MYGKHMTIEEMFECIADIIRDTDDCGMPDEYRPIHRQRLAHHFADTLQGIDARFNRNEFVSRAAPGPVV